MEPLAEASLSVNGRASSGESFDITIYFNDEDPSLLSVRVDALAEAAKAVARGVILTPATEQKD